MRRRLTIPHAFLYIRLYAVTRVAPRQTNQLARNIFRRVLAHVQQSPARGTTWSSLLVVV